MPVACRRSAGIAIPLSRKNCMYVSCVHSVSLHPAVELQSRHFSSSLIFEALQNGHILSILPVFPKMEIHGKEARESHTSLGTPRLRFPGSPSPGFQFKDLKLHWSGEGNAFPPTNYFFLHPLTRIPLRKIKAFTIETPIPAHLAKSPFPTLCKQLPSTQEWTTHIVGVGGYAI